MAVLYQVIVSSENSLYMGWQTQLFCFSAWTVLGQRPIVIVHGSSEPLRPEFLALQDRGFRIEQVPSYATTPTGLRYPPRNEIGTMVELASMSNLCAEYILFCEPDMLFVCPPDYDGSLAAEFYVYLHYEEVRVATAARKLGLGHQIGKLNEICKIGVPYLLPIRYIGQLASRWIEVIDAFEELQWIDIMYAFGIATTIEKLDVEVTHMMTDNYRPMRPLRRLIHYCFEDPTWNKRNFKLSTPFELTDKALAKGLPGTVLGEIMRQIKLAKQFFSESSKG